MGYVAQKWQHWILIQKHLLNDVIAINNILYEKFAVRIQIWTIKSTLYLETNEYVLPPMVIETRDKERKESTLFIQHAQPFIF